MPISYILSDSELSFTTVGDVDYSQGLAVLTEGLSRYAATKPASARVLFDLTLSAENRSSAELSGIARVVTAQLPGARIALVVQSDLHFGLSRIFSAFAGEQSEAIRVFRNLADARAWLAA